ncbi:MAG: type II toxin-antitoxin system VapC family toxin [Chloroflexota bacterium]|nr:type II toxin-antitoxin system VapC family toxin [Chloroflexota bacterium]
MTTGAEAYVIDASVAVKWHLRDEEHLVQADQLLYGLAAGRLTLAAPVHIHYEFPSALLSAHRRRAPRLSRLEAEAAITEFLATGVTLYHTTQLVSDAVPLVFEHDIAFYDAIYVALARALPARFVTADRRLYEQIEQLPEVVRLGDYQPVL